MADVPGCFVNSSYRFRKMESRNKERSVNLDVPVARDGCRERMNGGQIMYNRDGFAIRPCGCRVRQTRICKHFYSNERSASTGSASGTDPGDGGTESRYDPELVHPGDPQPAPSFFHFPSDGSPARLVSPDVRGETREHTSFLRGAYRSYLWQWRRKRRPNP